MKSFVLACKITRFFYYTLYGSAKWCELSHKQRRFYVAKTLVFYPPDFWYRFGKTVIG